jgi:hypothetical protein
MKTLISILIIMFLGLPTAYLFLMEEGKYTVQTGFSIFDLPLATDSITEDTIQHKITFTDLNFKKKYIIQGNYIIKPK